MGTNSHICIEKQDGSLDYIYCHNDSYPAYAGLVLYTFYNTEAKVKKLISLGDLSSIGVRIGQKTDFDKISSLYGTREYNILKCQCIAYSRDRGEEKTIYHSKDRESYFKSLSFNPCYIYIFKDGIWYVKSSLSSRVRKLKNVLKEEWVIKGKRNQNLTFYIDDEYLTSEERIALYHVYEELQVLHVFALRHSLSPIKF